MGRPGRQRRRRRPARPAAHRLRPQRAHPQFEGITFHEVLCKSALNKVPNAAMLPFRYTVNGYRGCSARLSLLFRPAHPRVPRSGLRHGLRHPGRGQDQRRRCAASRTAPAVVAAGDRRAGHQHRSLSTGRGALRADAGNHRALADSGTPFSILTKGTLLRRDLPLHHRGRQGASTSASRCRWPSAIPNCTRMSSRARPSPQARLGLISAIRDAGLGCHVMVAPVLPRLTDSVEHLDCAARSRSPRQARNGVTVFGLHLRGSTRGWFMGWLA